MPHDFNRLYKFRDVNYLARTHAICADLNKNEGKTSRAKEILIKAIEILKECGAYGWVKNYEKKLAAIS